MTSDNLKPCPFCGSLPVLNHCGFSDFWVECYICETWTGNFETEIEAINAWEKGIFKEEEDKQ